LGLVLLKEYKFKKNLFNISILLNMEIFMIKGLALFANVGIGELLLKNTDVKIAVANELLPERARFYSEVHPESNMICGDITNKDVYDSVITQAKKEKIKFIIATPPCQGMSVAGKMNPNDIRNKLILKVADAIDDTNPDYVLIENVPQMLKTYIVVDKKNVKIIDFLMEKYSDKYLINFGVLDAADYGTPQHRKRTIVLMSKKKNGEWLFPEKMKKITVRDVIGDLPSLESGDKSDIRWHNAKNHNDNHILWMRHTPTGQTALNNLVFYPKKNDRKIKGFMTTYKRIAWDAPAPTVTMANGSISSQNNVHPGRPNGDGTFSDARVLTILEIMRISGIPDDWAIPLWASDNLIRQVVGEMAPPNLIYNLVKNLPRKFS
jgi:DNA (cytosine-5)-methyltransferase 1